MNARFFNGYLALGTLMLALPMSAAMSSASGGVPAIAMNTAVASIIMPESAGETLVGPAAIGNELDRIVEMESTETGATDTIESNAAVDPAEALFRADWGAAHPEVYTRIAMAFDTEALNGADLMGVECRASLCKVIFQADRDIPVGKLLPMQLAESFHAMVTVHAGGNNHVYVDVPQGS